MQKQLVECHVLNDLEISTASSTLSAIRKRCTVILPSFIIFLLWNSCRFSHRTWEITPALATRSCTHKHCQSNWAEYHRKFSKNEQSFLTIKQTLTLTLIPCVVRPLWTCSGLFGWRPTSGYRSTWSTSSSLIIDIGCRSSFDTSPYHWWSCFSGSCITDMELSSAGGHVIENSINIQILTEDLSVFSFFSWCLVFFEQWLQCSALYTLIYDNDFIMIYDYP